MQPSNNYTVTLEQASPRGIAAVHARLPESRVTSDFRTYLDQVYAAARAGTVHLDGQNIFTYRDVEGMPGHVDAEFGVGIKAPFAAAGNVVYGVTPSGQVATTTHWGDYGRLGEAHAAVVTWCLTHDVRLAGPRWQLFGHWREGEVPRTDVYYLVEPGRANV